jgi:hypothetical protein
MAIEVNKNQSLFTSEQIVELLLTQTISFGLNISFKILNKGNNKPNSEQSYKDDLCLMPEKHTQIKF